MGCSPCTFPVTHFVSARGTKATNAFDPGDTGISKAQMLLPHHGGVSPGGCQGLFQCPRGTMTIWEQKGGIGVGWACAELCKAVWGSHGSC